MSKFRRLAIVSTLATLALITLGAVVRSTDSGLGCADAWPDCSGRLIPDFHNHHVVIEFSHRVLAGIVMVLIGALVVRAIRGRAEHPRLVVPSIVAFALVLLQAGLGAVVVKLELEAESVVLHLAAALSVLAALVYLVALASPPDGALAEPTDADTARTTRWAAGATLFLLAVGSYMSGIEGSGRAFNDWPLMDGKLVPDLAVEEKAIHFFHRGVAAIVGLILLVTLMRIVRRKAEFPTAARLAHLALGLFAVEILIGAANVWTDLHPAIVTLHLLAGTLIWGSLVGIVLVTSPAFRAKVAPGPSASAQPVGQGA
jgi:cytochrome c oxidase assembly protein subunit 15